MAIRSDSYGSVAEVLAFTRYLLRGESTFNSTTRPTLTEVEKFIDRASAALNVALKGAGFSSPLNSTTATSTAILLVDDWVVDKAVEFVELTQPGAGFNDSEGNRTAGFAGLHKSALEFAQDFSLALKREGATVSDPTHQGLTYTGLDKDSERSDPDSTTLEQPKFKRGLFDSKG